MHTKIVGVLWGCFFLWNLYTSSARTIYPGIKARATQRALDYGVQAGMEMIEQMLKEKNIPDLKGSESLEFLKVDYVNYNFSKVERRGNGCSDNNRQPLPQLPTKAPKTVYREDVFVHLEVSLKVIKINAFSFPNTSLAFVPGVGIKALTNHGTANISTDWEIKSPLFQDTGGADLFLSGVYFTGIIVLARNDFGHPILKLQDCYAQVNHAHVSFSGELSVLYNSFAEPMEKPILKNLNEMGLSHKERFQVQYDNLQFFYSYCGQLCPIIMNEVEALNANLSTIEVLTKIDNYTLLDYSLISSPEITENYIDLNLKGVVYPLEDLTDPPFSPVPFVLPERSDSMLYVGISEFFFKSASFAYFTAGAFNVTLSTKEISNHLVQNSQGVGNVLSRIAEIYILSQPFLVRVMATEPPVISLLPGNFTLDIPASIMILTQSKNSTAEAIVSMDFVASTSVGLVILGQRLVCSLSLNRFRLSLPESNRSNIEVLRFENILSSILHFGILPLANAKLQQGFPLPNPHKISFVNSDIEVFEGFLLISTDLKYETSLKQQPSFHGWEGLNFINGQWRGKPAA
ncbi:BPI fold-containing family C protein [Prionailurus iriomotensis]